MTSLQHPNYVVPRPLVHATNIPSLLPVPLALPSRVAVDDLRIPEGRLIPAPRGAKHYVGPASSFIFAQTVRHLVSKCNLDALHSFDSESLQRHFHLTEFTSFSTSQALEARIEGHPATHATDDDHPTPASDGGSVLPPSLPFPNLFDGSPRPSLSQILLRDSLPSRPVCDAIVQAFFERVHPNFTIFHRGTFQMGYESVWSLNTSNWRSIDGELGWTCSLLMVIVLGAQALEGEGGLEGSTALQQRLLSRVVKDGLHRLVLTASLTNVQALMLLSLYQHNAGERNTAWMLLGQAARTAVALGMHRDGETGYFDAMERNSRRMVWWLLHIFEQSLSFALGRPSSTDLPDVTVSLPDETMMDGGDLPASLLVHAVSLTAISSKVKRFTATISTQYDQPDFLAPLCHAAEHLIAQLDAWFDSLPPHLANREQQSAPPRHRRAVLLLQMMAAHYKSVLGRTFLLCQVNYTLDSRVQQLSPLNPGITSIAHMSTSAALLAIRTLQRLASTGSLEGSVWTDFYYVHHSVLVVCLPFLERPISPMSSAADNEVKQAVSTILFVAQQTRLAPTYRILVNVALQFAHIVGCGPEWPMEEVEAAPPPLPIPPALGSALDLDFDAAASLNSSASTVTTALPSGGTSGWTNSSTDMFADLYNFGVDPMEMKDMTWDFFNVGSFEDPT